MARTPDQNAADSIGRTIDNAIASLHIEREVLVAAAPRIVDIDAELLVLQAEKARIDPRRPPAVALPNAAAPAAVDATSKARVK